MCGRAFKRYGGCGGEVNSKTQVRHFADKEALMKELPELLEKGDTVLVKASHFMEFGEIVEKLS